MDGPTQSVLRPLRNLPTSPDFPEPLLPVLSPGWEEPQGDGDSLTAATTDSVNDSVLRARGSCTGRQPELGAHPCSHGGTRAGLPHPAPTAGAQVTPEAPVPGGGGVSGGWGTPSCQHSSLVLQMLGQVFHTPDLPVPQTLTPPEVFVAGTLLGAPETRHPPAKSHAVAEGSSFPPLLPRGFRGPSGWRVLLDLAHILQRWGLPATVSTASSAWVLADPDCPGQKPTGVHTPCCSPRVLPPGATRWAV